MQIPKTNAMRILDRFHRRLRDILSSFSTPLISSTGMRRFVCLPKMALLFAAALSTGEASITEGLRATYYNGTNWSVEPCPVQTHLYGVFVFSPTDLYVVGQGGLIYHNKP